MLRSLIAAIVIMIAASTVGSADVRAQSNTPANSQPTSDQLLEALKAKGTRGVQPSAEDASRDAALNKLLADLKEKSTRGLSVTDHERAALAEAVKDKPQVDLEVNFDFNAAEISDRNRKVMTELGRALQKISSEGTTFVVAGHTDAKGRPSYNQALSERRAQAVKDFLVSEFNIPAGQLLAIGYGQERLKDPKNPYADENRRVQIVNATSEVATSQH